MGPLQCRKRSRPIRNRLTINRNSAYSPPKWAEGLATGLPSFDTRQCSSGITATLDPNTAENSAFKERTPPTPNFETDDPNDFKRTREENAKLLFERIKKYAFAEQSQHLGDGRPGLHPAGAVQPDLRQRPRHAVPAHLRTERSLSHKSASQHGLQPDRRFPFQRKYVPLDDGHNFPIVPNCEQHLANIIRHHSLQ